MDDTENDMVEFTKNIEVDLDNYLSEFDSFQQK